MCVWAVSHTNAESELHLYVVTQKLKQGLSMGICISKRAFRFDVLRKDAFSEAAIRQ